MRELGSFKRLIVLGFSLITIAFETLVYSWFWLTDFSIQIRQGGSQIWYTFKGHALAIAVYALLLFAFSSMYGGLKVGYLKTTEVVFSQVFSTLIVNVITYGQDSLIYWWLMNPKPFIIMTLIQCVGVFCWSMIAQRFYRFLFAPRKMLLIHGDRPYQDLIRKFESRKDKYEICKCMHVNAGIDAICKEAVERYDAVVLGDIDVASRNTLYKFCYGKGIRVYILPKISDVLLGGAEEMHIFDTPIFLTREYSLTIEQRFIKRSIDVICSSILLVLASPIMLLTAIAIKLYDGGPVIYRQIRCTRDMREFGIMKFRSMRVDAEKDGVARLATKNDSRITPIGKFIRKVRIDELPQLINILKTGDHCTVCGNHAGICVPY